MRRLATFVISATLGGLALSFAWLRFDPVNEPLAVPEWDKQEPPPRMRYRGDVLGFVKTSRIMPSLTDRGRVSLIALANAEEFSTPAVGYSGMRPPSTNAFRKLMREPERRAAFAELTRFRNGAAAAYGLAGLYLIDRTAFASAASRLKGSQARVRTQIGCIIGDTTVAALVGCVGPDRLCIGNGVWPARLRSDDF